MIPTTANSKIKKAGNADPDAFETSIAQALLELEMNSDLKAQLRELNITKARELEINNKKVSEPDVICFTFNVFLHSRIILSSFGLRAFLAAPDSYILTHNLETYPTQ